MQLLIVEDTNVDIARAVLIDTAGNIAITIPFDTHELEVLNSHSLM